MIGQENFFLPGDIQMAAAPPSTLKSEEKFRLADNEKERVIAALEETETALRQLAQAKGYDDGVASIYDSIQGMGMDEVDYGRRKELLAIVFVENLDAAVEEYASWGFFCQGYG